MRRVGKIGRQIVFPKVKNVNVKSLKKTLKIVGFLEQREGVTSRVTSYCHFLFYVRYKRYV